MRFSVFTKNTQREKARVVMEAHSAILVPSGAEFVVLLYDGMASIGRALPFSPVCFSPFFPPSLFFFFFFFFSFGLIMRVGGDVVVYPYALS